MKSFTLTQGCWQEPVKSLIYKALDFHSKAHYDLCTASNQQKGDIGVPVDILIFAAIAAFLIFRLRSVLGTRHGEERQRQNPFVTPEGADAQNTDNAIDLQARTDQPTAALANMSSFISNDPAVVNAIETGLTDIAKNDVQFNLAQFMGGAKGAFEMIVTAYVKGDLPTLQSLLSPKLFSDFSAAIKNRESLGQTLDTTLHRIKAARVIEARLAGTMAYVTVDFDAEETSVTKNADGQVVDGSPDHLFSVRDIWTFTRDVRAADPNWMLIETRTP